MCPWGAPVADLPGPLSPEAIAAGQDYYGGQSVAPAGAYASDPASYYGPPRPPPAPADPVVHAYPEATPREIAQPVDPASLPYQPNPGLPNYNPNPGAPLPGGKGMLAPVASLDSPPAGRDPKPAAPAPAKPATPTVPAGPTAQDDAEFAALMRLQGMKRPSASGGGGGAPAPANRDPYGILDSYRMQGEGVMMQTDAERERAARRAEMLATAARHKEEDAVIAQSEQAEADRRFNESQAEVQKQLDQVRAQKVDPDRLMRSDGMAFRAIVGGLFGGIYMGLNKLSSNPFIDQLNKQIDRDIAAQEKNIDNSRAAAMDKMNLLRDQRAQWKDSQAARLQARNLAYEATLTQIEAEMVKYDDPISQARGAQAIAAIQREQGQVQKQLDAERARLAAAGAAAGMADVKAKRELFKDTYNKGIEHGMTPQQAEQEAYIMIDRLYGSGNMPRQQTQAGGADPISMVPKEQRQKAIEEQEKYAGAQAAKKAVQQVFSEYEKAPDLPTWTGAKGREAVLSSGLLTVRQALGEGFSSDKDTEKFIENNLPKYGESEATRQQKLHGLLRFLDGKSQTPILDRHAPGWRGPAAPQKFDPNGKPVR